MGSGLIYLAIVIVWAAILIPMFLRSRDHALEDRSVERFDHAMNILSQQEAAELPQSPEVGRHPADTQVPRTHVAERQPQRTKSPRRRRSLARRRARTLTVLFALTMVAVLMAFTPYAPLWTPLPFVVLLVAFVVHLRNQAIRKERGTVRHGRTPRDVPSRDIERPASQASEPVSQAEAASKNEESARHSARVEFVPGPSRAVVVETKGAPVSDDEAWRPNPLPLPTYVTAPKAVRPIRVIDLTSPGAWTSGRLFDDDLAMEDVLAEQVASDELDELLEHESRGSRSDDDASRRAVGD